MIFEYVYLIVRIVGSIYGVVQAHLMSYKGVIGGVKELE